MKRLLVVAACFLLAPHITEKFAVSGEVVGYWPNGIVRSRTVANRYPDGRTQPHGPAVVYHRNGTKSEEGTYRRGKHHGLWQFWYATGELYAQGTFEDGEGVFTGYFRSGGKRWEGPYRDGRREGGWREWDEEGRLRKEGSYVDDKEQGTWQYWNPDGDPEYEEIKWERGIMLLDDIAPPLYLLPLSPWRHVGQTGLVLLFLLGPWPLLAWANDRTSVGKPPSLISTALTLLLGWIVLQTFVAWGLALLHVLAAPGWIAAQILILALGIGLVRKDGWPPAPHWPRSLSFGEAALVLAFLVLLGGMLWDGLVLPITDWDSMAYHMPVMARWYQDAKLVDLPELGQPARYPFNIELLTTSALIPLREDALAVLPVLVFWIVLAGATYGLSRRLGTTRAQALASSLLLCTMPHLLRQTEEIKSDLPLVGLFMVSLYVGGFLGGARRLAWLALSLGLLIGTKASGPLYAAMVVVALLIDRRLRAPANNGSQSSGVWIALPVAALLSLGWYVRNWIDLGNPMGYVQLQLGGWVLFSGPIHPDLVRSTTIASVFDPSESLDWRILFLSMRRDLGWGFFALVILGGLSAAGLRTRLRPWRRSLLLLFCMFVVATVTYVITPYSGDNGSHDFRMSLWVGDQFRFWFPALALLAVIASAGWRWFPARDGLVAAVPVLIAVLTMTLTVVTRPLALWVIVLSSLLLVLWISDLTNTAAAGLRAHAQRIWSSRVARGALILGVTVFATWLLFVARERRDELRPVTYGTGYEYVTRAPADEVIAYAMTEMRYPLFGKHFDQTVFAASVRGGEPSEWYEWLRANGVDVLMVGGKTRRRLHTPPEVDVRPWLTAPGAPFEMIQDYGEGAEGVAVYRFLTPSGSESP